MTRRVSTRRVLRNGVRCIVVTFISVRIRAQCAFLSWRCQSIDEQHPLSSQGSCHVLGTQASKNCIRIPLRCMAADAWHVNLLIWNDLWNTNIFYTISLLIDSIKCDTINVTANYRRQDSAQDGKLSGRWSFKYAHCSCLDRCHATFANISTATHRRFDRQVCYVCSWYITQNKALGIKILNRVTPCSPKIFGPTHDYMCVYCR